ALVDRRADHQRRRRRDVVDGNRGLVLGEAAVLVDDPGADGEAAVVGVGAGRAGAGARAGVGRRGEAGVGARVGVVEAGGRVDARWVGLGREGDRRRAALVDRAVV